MLLSKTAQVIGCKYIRTYSLLRELFKERYMFVCCDMEDNVRSHLREKTCHPPHICNIGNIWIQACRIWMRSQTLCKIKKPCLVRIQSDHTFWLIVQQLLRQF